MGESASFSDIPTLGDEGRREDIAERHAAFRDRLLQAGLLIDTGLDGLYGRDGAFERIIDGIDAVVRRAGTAAYGSSVRIVRFPPVFPRESFEKTDYIASFPNLTGAVSTFTGDNREHRRLLADREAGIDWDGHLSPAGTMLVSAACHPVYSTLPTELPDDGVLVDIYGYCFRHEPSIDPARMQAFRMHEYVHIGTAESAEKHRDSWIPRGLGVLEELGLPAQAVVANDPFFGRAGTILAANQLTENLKTELVVPIYGDDYDGTAVVSCNCHRDHFGETFGIRTADGQMAHSACVGFGMERIALALISTHGTDIARWPAHVRRTLFGDE